MKLNRDSLKKSDISINNNDSMLSPEKGIQTQNILLNLQKHQQSINKMYLQLQQKHLINENGFINEKLNLQRQTPLVAQIGFDCLQDCSQVQKQKVLKPKSIQQQINEQKEEKNITNQIQEDMKKKSNDSSIANKNSIKDTFVITQSILPTYQEHVVQMYPQNQLNHVIKTHEQTNNASQLMFNQNALFEFTPNLNIFKKNEKDNTHFQIVANLLVKTFCNQQIKISDLTQLQDFQLQIYLKILERRFKTSINSKQSIQNLTMFLNNQISVSSNSYLRSEEQYKFVLKKVIRIMKIEIKKELDVQRLPSTNSYVNKQFLVKYFDDLARQLKLSLDVFVPPTNINFKSTFKTVNKDYFSLIKKSDLFVKDFMRITKYILIPFYVNEISEKFTYLTKQFNEQLEASNTLSFNQKVQQILHSLQTKRKLKLPWDLKTVEDSIKITNKQFFSQFNFFKFQIYNNEFYEQYFLQIF